MQVLTFANQLGIHVCQMIDIRDDMEEIVAEAPLEVTLVSYEAMLCLLRRRLGTFRKIHNC